MLSDIIGYTRLMPFYFKVEDENIQVPKMPKLPKISKMNGRFAPSFKQC
jgi:hypothetical protein